MIANDTLDALQAQVSKFLDQETYKPLISDRYYAHELERSLEAKLKAIVDDLENDHEVLLQEDCEESIVEFKAALNALKERMTAIKTQYEWAIDVIQEKDNAVIVEAETAFCRRIALTFESVISNLELWATESLSKAEANKNYFASVFYLPEELVVIYNNLVAARWIQKSRTSRSDFLYYFTGEGPKPYNPIRWNKPATWLSLFLDKMTEDSKIWAKATLVFETQDSDSGSWDAVTRKTLSVSFRNINDANSFEEVNNKVLSMLPK